ncbi:MAG: glycerophosphodiester phosphodiesterase [Solirubrobacterales bacterium]
MKYRIGHKGADLLEPGNTICSFERAVEIGVDLIELDVLWTPGGEPELPPDEREPLMVAHDLEAAHSGRHPSLAEALDAFLRPPLDRVEINCDIKLPGREPELVAALAERDLISRAMISTPHVEAIEAVRRLEPGLRRGRTFPKVKRAWDQIRWARPGVLAALGWMRVSLPRTLGRSAAELGLSSCWVVHPLITPKLVGAARSAGIELMAWTVDDAARVRELEAMGVDGICSNDPRLLNAAGTSKSAA